MSTAPILVVEDNPTTRKMLRLTLQAEGYAVCEAENGKRALRLASERALALVLMDCRLPDLDGFEVARRLHSTTPSLPLVAITGWTQDEASVLTSGFLDVLIKPVEPARLIQVVEQYVGQAAPRSSETGKLVLVADDDPVQRKLLVLALSSAGCEVVAAEDGLAALELSRKRRPSVIVSDVLMPGMDGFNLCKAIREDPILAEIPVVLTSAHYLEQEDRDLAGRFGASRYVSRTAGFAGVVEAALDMIEAPESGNLPVVQQDLQDDYLRRLSRQLERQASINSGLVRRTSLQATALSVLDGISDALARQVDPENALAETLSQCLDAAGLSVGAILLHDSTGKLTVKAHVGSLDDHVLLEYAEVLEGAVGRESLIVPSDEASPLAAELVAHLGVRTAIIVPIIARDATLGVMLLASNSPEFVRGEASSLLRAARSVSMQLGQALAVGRSFSRLAAAEERYRTLLESARDAISILSPDGVILEVNRSWEEILGQPRECMLGHHIVEFAPEGQSQANLESYRAAVAKGGASIPPTPIRRADGSLAYVEFSSTVAEVGGERFVLAIGRDVTDREKLGEQLRHAQKMEAVGRLAGGVAHDMNNILAAVLSYSELLLEELNPGDPRRCDAEQILKAAGRGASLTRQLLAFSRQQAATPRVLDLNEVAVGLVKMLRPLIGEDIEIEMELCENLPRVKVDMGHIEQVIMNLAVNARDAMPEGGKLVIATVVEDERVRLSMKDTGSGMDASTRERIFEPFFTTKEQGKGTGLGLSTVFGIVKHSGGEIRVDTKLGRGTVFHIYLPKATEGDAEQLAVPVYSGARKGTETILLVEDDDALRAALARTLERQGYTVLAARTGAEAINICESHAGVIHLLVTDVVLPGMSGQEIAVRIRIRHPTIKSLFMSGYTDTTAHRQVPVGSQGFLQKPFGLDAFVARIRDTLSAGNAPASAAQRSDIDGAEFA